MTEPLKNYLNASVVRDIARDLKRAHSPFAERAFVRECVHGLDTLELTARGWHIAEAVHRHLPGSFPEAAAVVQAALGPELNRTDAFGSS